MWRVSFRICFYVTLQRIRYGGHAKVPEGCLSEKCMGLPHETHRRRASTYDLLNTPEIRDEPVVVLDPSTVRFFTWISVFALTS